MSLSYVIVLALAVIGALVVLAAIL